ncbi:uncharacterized protein LOC122972274 isoform X2 [Thunnus albacares]|uniref:uncharacterized protein LOC122972274 isoform X2 n=1 Tax=Thunnus albacares TaxID=8236 RepID=UPI001CF698A4|nr:uncharacterized protein LOC122972274 isoform X2 [Thunnus albacares]
MNSCRGGIMVKLKEELLKTLEDLKENEFKKFKWFLEQDDILEGFKGIPVAQLEKARRRDTVDLMVQTYQDHGALQVTMKVLEKINRNDLVQRLQNLPSGPKVTSHQRSCSAQSGSNVVAPSITGSKIGNININITSTNPGSVTSSKEALNYDTADVCGALQPQRPGPAETPSVPADEKLKSVRRQFIARVSEAVLRQLLDILLEREIINDGEMDSARTPNREIQEKAGLVIDMVRKKGPKASSALIAALCEVDKFLSTELKLQ